MFEPDHIFTGRCIVGPERVLPTIGFRTLENTDATETIHRCIVCSQHIGTRVADFQVQIFRRFFP